MSFGYATSQAIIDKAGVNVNATAAASGALVKSFSDEAEGFFNSVARINNSDVTINAQLAGIYAMGVTAMAGRNLVHYDMSGYTSRAEAQTMLDVLTDEVQLATSLIRDKKTTSFLASG